jgi:parallel beta-helix repeat protein
MPRHYIGCLLATILLAITVATALTTQIQPASAGSKTLIVPQDYPTINAALSNALQGDTIQVKNGVYHENLVITKQVALVGEDKASTFIDGDGKSSVVWINADDASISGFTVRNSGSELTDSGIYVNNSQSVKLSSNIVTGNNIGVYISESANSTLIDNSLSGNVFNFGVYSSNIEGYIQNIDTSNTVDGKLIVYLVNQSNRQTPTDAGYVAIVNCSGITVRGGLLEKNWQNMLFAYTRNSTAVGVTSTLGEDSFWLIESTNCTLQAVNITGNIWGGIALVNSTGCTIKDGILKANGGYGLFLSDSSSNQFYHNNFISNPRQAWLYGLNSNSWDNGYPSGGNYWDNYTGVDEKSGAAQSAEGSDGIGDTAVVIAQNNIDTYPLMAPYAEQVTAVTPLQLEYSIMEMIAVLAVVIIFAVYYVKNRKQSKTREQE